MDGVGEGAEKELLQNFGAVSRVFNTLPEGSRGVIRDITQRMGDGMADYVSVDMGQEAAPPTPLPPRPPAPHSLLPRRHPAITPRDRRGPRTYPRTRCTATRWRGSWARGSPDASSPAA